MASDEHFQKEIIMTIPVIRQSKFQPTDYQVVVAIGDTIARKKVIESLHLRQVMQH